MPDALQRDMSATGTSHLVAVSGQNVSLLAGLIIAAFAWVIGRRPAAGAAMVAIVGYTVLVGAQPSVIRSAIMGGLYILAIASGRQATAPLALFMAAAVMTAVDPQIVHEISFQLSFAATLGLVTLAPLLAQHMWVLVARSRLLSSVPWTRAVTDMFAVSLSASLFTVPISAITFGTISLISPVANLFITPAFLAVAVTSAIAAGLVAILPASTTVAAWIAWPPAEYMVQAAGWFAAIPFASANIAQVASTETAIPWYMALFAFTVWLSKRRLPEEPVDHFSLPMQRLAPAVGLATLAALAAILAWHTLAHDHQGRVSVTVLDVGQGEAILVEDAVGHRVLVDGGPNSQGIREALSHHLPFDDRRIDMVVLTHPQADHLGGLLEVLDSYNVSIVLDTSASVDSDLRDAWAESLTGSVPTVSAARRGQRIELAGGTLDIVAPAHDPAYKTLDLNDHSTILRLSVGEISFLLTGDLGNDGERLLMRSGEDIHADVLKVGHHGSRLSSSAEFLSRVDPSVSLISVGMDSPYGHPSQEVLGRLDESLLYRTDESGDITMSTDGTHLWVDTER